MGKLNSFIFGLLVNPEFGCLAFASAVNVLAQGVVVYRYNGAVKQLRANHEEKLTEHPGVDFSSNLEYNLRKARDNAYGEAVACTAGAIFSPALAIGAVLTLPVWLPAGLVYAGIRLGGATG